MEKTQALIFDFDGTIADTFHQLLVIGNRLSDEYDYNRVDPNEVELLKDKNARQTIQHLKIPLLKIPAIVARVKKEMHKEIASVKPVEGLKEILQELKRLGFKMGILSSNSLKNVRAFLKSNDLMMFDFIHSTHKIWSKNKILLDLLKEHGLPAENTVYIGDETRDIIAAQKAGLRSAAVAWGYNSYKALKAHRPDYLINSPQELYQILG